MSVKKTINVFDEKGILFTNGYMRNGAFVAGLSARAITVNTHSNVKIAFAKYSVLFDKYFLFGGNFLMETMACIISCFALS